MTRGRHGAEAGKEATEANAEASAPGPDMPRLLHGDDPQTPVRRGALLGRVNAFGLEPSAGLAQHRAECVLERAARGLQAMHLAPPPDPPAHGRDVAVRHRRPPHSARHHTRPGRRAGCRRSRSHLQGCQNTEHPHSHSRIDVARSVADAQAAGWLRVDQRNRLGYNKSADFLFGTSCRSGI